MARRAQITPADLALRLQAGGPMTAQALAAALGVDRSTISRGLARMEERVRVMGAARRACYGLRRMVRAAGDRWPVYRIDSAGRASEWARLEALHGGWCVDWAGQPPVWAERMVDREGFTDGFPFFLGDLRPQGFIGRAVTRSVAETLRLPGDPRQWGDDDTLQYLQSGGDDLPGNLVLGDSPLRAVLARQMEPDDGDVIFNESDVVVRYPELAVRAMGGEWVGSSAGGEQPKFLTGLRLPTGTVRQVLVKFSPPLETEPGRRWSDLLVAEAQALAVLAEQGLAAEARVLDAGGRRFLEVNRHDRVERHGRRGVVSLEALYAAMGHGSAGNWAAAGEALVRAGLLDPTGGTHLVRMHAFGDLIGNTDMHFGNLSFWLEDSLPFQPAPIHDMLPMRWAPSRFGEPVPAANAVLAPQPPVPVEMPAWRAAAAWALEFWRRVGADSRVSPEFGAMANAAGDNVARMRAHFPG